METIGEPEAPPDFPLVALGSPVDSKLAGGEDCTSLVPGLTTPMGSGHAATTRCVYEIPSNGIPSNG